MILFLCTEAEGCRVFCQIGRRSNMEQDRTKAPLLPSNNRQRLLNKSTRPNTNLDFLELDYSPDFLWSSLRSGNPEQMTQCSRENCCRLSLIFRDWQTSCDWPVDQWFRSAAVVSELTTFRSPWSQLQSFDFYFDLQADLLQPSELRMLLIIFQVWSLTLSVLWLCFTKVMTGLCWIIFLGCL